MSALQNLIWIGCPGNSVRAGLVAMATTVSVLVLVAFVGADQYSNMEVGVQTHLHEVLLGSVPSSVSIHQRQWLSVVFQ